MLGTSRAKNHQQNIDTKWRENKNKTNPKSNIRRSAGLSPSQNCPILSSRGSLDPRPCRAPLPALLFSLPPRQSRALTWRGKTPPNLTLRTQRSPGQQGFLSFPLILGFSFQARIKKRHKEEIVVNNSRAKSGAYGKKKKNQITQSRRVRRV